MIRLKSIYFALIGTVFLVPSVFAQSNDCGNGELLAHEKKEVNILKGPVLKAYVDSNNNSNLLIEQDAAKYMRGSDLEKYYKMNCVVIDNMHQLNLFNSNISKILRLKQLEAENKIIEESLVQARYDLAHEKQLLADKYSTIDRVTKLQTILSQIELNQAQNELEMQSIEVVTGHLKIYSLRQAKQLIQETISSLEKQEKFATDAERDKGWKAVLQLGSTQKYEKPYPYYPGQVATSSRQAVVGLEMEVSFGEVMGAGNSRKYKSDQVRFIQKDIDAIEQSFPNQIKVYESLLARAIAQEKNLKELLSTIGVSNKSDNAIFERKKIGLEILAVKAQKSGILGVLEALRAEVG